MLTISHVLMTSLLIVIIASIGFITNKGNFIRNLVCIEILLLVANLNFLVGTHHFKNPVGYVMVIAVLAIAAVEVMLGLAIMIVYHKHRGEVSTAGAISIAE